MSLDYEVNSVNEESREAKAVQKRNGPHRGGPPQMWIQSCGPLMNGPVLLVGLASLRRRRCCGPRGPISWFIAIGRIPGLVNLDRALKVCAVLDHDPRRSEVADHRPVLLNLDAIARSQIPFYIAVYHDFAGDNVCRHFSARTYR